MPLVTPSLFTPLLLISLQLLHLSLLLRCQYCENLAQRSILQGLHFLPAPLPDVRDLILLRLGQVQRGQWNAAERSVARATAAARTTTARRLRRNRCRRHRCDQQRHCKIFQSNHEYPLVGTPEGVLHVRVLDVVRRAPFQGRHDASRASGALSSLDVLGMTLSEVEGSRAPLIDWTVRVMATPRPNCEECVAGRTPAGLYPRLVLTRARPRQLT